LTTRSASAALLAVAALGVGACGSKDDNAKVDNSVTPATTTPPPPAATTATTDTTATTATTATATATAKKPSSTKLKISKDLSKKPKIPRLTGPPPSKLVIQDIVKGHGKAATAADTITINYVGVSYSTGVEFDSSWKTGAPATFPLGNLIPGWQQGIPGMRPGGRRVLIIPPDLGYGANPDPSSGIAPNETLIFVIDLKKPA
jgi:peptidylprolyl isomerase